jgi:predicted permease
MDWPRWIDALRVRVRAISRPRRADRDLDDELSFHVAMQTRANLQDGMSARDAERRAHHSLGGVEQAKEQCRDARPLRWARDLVYDLRFAVRSLRRTPGFSIVVTLVLALGLGANTALFSVVSAVLLRPLPFADSNRIVRVWTSRSAASELPRSGTSLPDYQAWRAQNRTLEDLGAYWGGSYNLTGTDRPEVLPATRMTASVWTVLKAVPRYGRLFSAETETWGSHRVVVVGDRLWQRRFGADPQIVGRTIQLNGQPYTVVAVMPPDFQFVGPIPELWVPLSFPPGDAMYTRGNRSVDLLARLKPGGTQAQAQADLSAVAESVAREVPENAGLGVEIANWQESIVGQIRPLLLLLLGSVAVVLLIACANVANLLLARTAARDHELTVRATLGAGRGRLVRQLLTENLLLAALGAVFGIGLAYVLIRAIPGLGPIGVPRLREVTLDRYVTGFSIGLAVLTGLLVGVWPARRAGRASVSGALNESGRTVAGGRLRVRARRLLVTAEVSLSLVLLVGAGLLIVSLQRVVAVDPGFQPDHLLTASVTLPPLRYGNPERVEAFIRQVVDETSTLPGIRGAGATTTFPLAPSEWTKYFSIDGRPAPASLADVPLVRYRLVTPDFLQTMGASIRHGRMFTADDGPGRPPVAIINETIARRFWPDDDPLGKLISMNPPPSLVPERIRQTNARPPSLTVIGIVADFRQNGLEREANPEVFVPFSQSNGEYLPTFFLVARTSGDPLALTGAIQTVIGRLDRNIPLANPRTMDSRLSDSLAQRRFVMMLLGAFAGLALLLALVGLYGLMSFTVRQRRRELGVRAVLGASARDLLRLVLADGLRMAAIGVATGVPLAGALSQLITAQLFQVQAIDPSVYALVSLLLLIVAALACGLPAFRAARADPAIALRCE